MIYDPALECMERDRLRRLQNHRLEALLARLAAQVPLYRERIPQAVRAGLQPLDELPFTTRADLRNQYPLGLLAVPPEQVARFHATSGTRGKPTLVAYTSQDLSLWAGLCARLLAAAGARPADRLHVALNYGLFTGGLGIHGGAERLGCTVIPAGAGSTQRQVLLMTDLNPVGLKATPSYALHLAETARELGADPRRFGLRYGIFGAEPWSEELRDRLEAAFGFRAYDSYGLSEMLGPGVAFECQERQGLHLAEDHFLPEIVDPVSGRPLPPGEMGELVLTSLTKEAFPLLRYRTGDRTALLEEDCPCGRTSRRIGRVVGRVDEMLILRGVNLFPSELERVLLRFEQIQPRYQVRVWKEGALDAAEVLVELRAGSERDAVIPRVEAAIRAELGVGVRVRAAQVEPSTDRNKALRVIDERGGSIDGGARG